MGRASRARAERTKQRRTARPPAEIRPLTEQDLPVVQQLLEAGEVVATPDLAMYASRAPSRDNGFAFGSLATQDGAVAGVVVAQGVRLELPIDLSADLALLDAVAVADAARGRGIGSQLLDHATSRFRAFGHRAIIAKVAAGRRDLIPFYTKTGWSLGPPGAGVIVNTEHGPLALAEDPHVRIARMRLTSPTESSPLLP